MPEPSREFLRELLRQARITGPKLDDLVARALDPDYWRGLVPDCHIESAAAALEFAPVDHAAVDTANRSEKTEGYFHLPGILPLDGVRRLNAAIDAVTAAGWPPAFLFMFDEGWQCARLPGAIRVAEAILGPGFRQIPHVWAHVVQPAGGSAGWSPHVDGDPIRCLTVWVGLTPSTLDNGCMHVVPASVTRSLPDLTARFRASHSQFSRAEVSSLLHASRALVTEPGDALGWGFDVIHWGGFARQSAQERRALSFEYVAADQQRSGDAFATVGIDTLPAFDDRLRVVAADIAAYTTFEPMVDRFVGVAGAITKHLEPRG